ncbi:MAG: cellulose synthase/poly-beta-1,6-N-acetylglucosamine synthase-like glycosyltransferase [Flavobacteriales bacterium]|jgi:cellulose synthase/poly-beta-1,6-N-acetylglucosamine synthase-like glycosyltransferase
MIANFFYYFWILLNLLLFIFVLFESILLVISIISKKKEKIDKISLYPQVTIQLPLFNEKYVVERLIDSVCKINYPKGKMEIQILDDSSDETTNIIQKIIGKYLDLGFNIIHIRREERTGYKAGALDYGMKLSKSEFFAIFDADFIPNNQFLNCTLPFFNNSKIGVVQTRWTHINEKFSFITRAQAIMLNTHFSIEHLGRISSGAFINFNGTAGIWRKETIEDAGGWEPDTLTEDLDISFRAQVKGWKFKYLFDVESPAELPVTIDAYKTQQYRWSKGAAECVRKNMAMVWKSQVSIWAKMVGSMHLLNSSLYIIVFLLLLCGPLVFWLTMNNLLSSETIHTINYSNIFISLSIPMMFLVGHLMVSKQKAKDLLMFPVNYYFFVCITIAISFYMVVGVIEGYRGKKTAFIRTPKFNLEKEKSKEKKGYEFKKENNRIVFEFIILLYGLTILFLGFNYENLAIANFGLMISIGYILKIFFSKRIFRI